MDNNTDFYQKTDESDNDLSQNKDISMVDVNNLHESLSQMSIDDDSMANLQGFTPLTRQITTSTSLNTQSSIDSFLQQQQQQQDQLSDANSPAHTLVRKKSTLIFNDDYDLPEFREHADGPSEEDHARIVNSIMANSPLHTNEGYNSNGPSPAYSGDQAHNLSNNSNTSASGLPSQGTEMESSASSYSSVSNSNSLVNSPGATDADRPPVLIPVNIKWEQGGNSVYVTGSFTDWRKMIALIQDPSNPGFFNIILQLPPGNHRFRFIVDGELRISDYLPQATDQLGNFVNFLEVSSSSAGSQVSSPRGNNEANAAPNATGQQTQEPHAAANDKNYAEQHAQEPAQQQQQHQDMNGQQTKRNAYKIAGTGFTSLDEASKETSAAHVHMSNSSRLALQIARENDHEPEDMGNGFLRVKPGDKKPLLSNSSGKPIYQYTTDIPAVFTDPHVMEQYYLTLDQQRNNQQYMSWLTPPLLPPHLEKVILNASYSSTAPTNTAQGGNNSKPQNTQLHHSHHHHHHHRNPNNDSDSSVSSSLDKLPQQAQSGSVNENNSGALPIPNHVVLNHLITSSIKHNTLCVASTVRYKSKYATQILYAPLQ